MDLDTARHLVIWAKPSPPGKGVFSGGVWLCPDRAGRFGWDVFPGLHPGLSHDGLSALTRVRRGEIPVRFALALIHYFCASVSPAFAKHETTF